MPDLLVVDDEPLILDCFRFLFPDRSVTVRTATTAADGLRQFAQQVPDVVVLDVRLPDLSGLEAFRRFHEAEAKVPIVLITGHGSAATAIEAMRLGAYEYVVKPLDPAALRDIIARGFEISRLMRVPAKVAQASANDDAADVMVGECSAMQGVYKAIGRVATQDVTVLIRGESGTGKELVARAIYHYSHRVGGPFLAVNCAAIPETLLESELFGHEKGAFTGADRTRIGKFEQCNGGTIFLDEIGDMTSLTQAKILRVLQDKRFERVGGNDSIKTDVRVIAATNRDLETLITSGEFRGDLYYRLNVYSIRLPPLRERGDDLAVLAEHFLRRFAVDLGKNVSQFAPEALDGLRRYSWPGNVRELQSVLKQAILQATGPVVLADFLPAVIRGGTHLAPADNTDFRDLARFVERQLQAGAGDLYADFLALTERQLFLQVLAHTDNNLSHAVRILGISRATLRSRLAALGITIDRSPTVENG